MVRARLVAKLINQSKKTVGGDNTGMNVVMGPLQPCVLHVLTLYTHVLCGVIVCENAHVHQTTVEA